MSQMWDVNEESWPLVLNSILEDLGSEDYNKLRLLYLNEIPARMQTESCSIMTKNIIKCYGFLTSISVVHSALCEILRKDKDILDKLTPYVEHLRREQENQDQNQNQDMNQNQDQDMNQDQDQDTNKDQNQDMNQDQNQDMNQDQDMNQNQNQDMNQDQDQDMNQNQNQDQDMNQDQDQDMNQDQDQDMNQNQNQDMNKDQDQERGKKRKLEDETPTPSPGKRLVLGERSCRADNQNIPACSSSGHDSQERKALWMSISDVRSSGNLKNVTFRGSVVQKSALLQSKNKKFYFYVAAADKTASIKLLVFGKKHHRTMKEGLSYLFYSLIKDGDVVKVFPQCRVMETSTVDVPENVQQEARHLIYPESPASSIQDVKAATAKKEVTVEGKVTAIHLADKVQVKDERKTTKIQKFELRDETDAIKICMWSEATRQINGLSEGDHVKVTNVKVHHYQDDVQLDSTRFTNIHKVQSAGDQEVRISIVAVGDTTKKEIQLTAERNQELRQLVVAPRLLAKAFGIKPDGGVREWLMKKLPLSVDVRIRGCEISEITAAS